MFIKNNTIQHADGFLNKTPIFQFLLLSSVFALWSAAAALNDVLITQFKSIFELSNFEIGRASCRERVLRLV